MCIRDSHLVAQLLAQLRDEPVPEAHLMLRPELVVRESSGKANCAKALNYKH